MSLIIRPLTPADERPFFEGLEEWQGQSLHWHTFTWKPGMSYQEMLTLLEKESAGRDIAPGRVPHTMLYGFLEGKIIGRVSVRHTLNEHLRRRGGHMGYAVAPKYRQQGYATELARQGLEYCRKLGLASVLITCAEENTPSWKIIERLGGKLEGRVWDEEEKETIRRYWISLHET